MRKAIFILLSVFLFFCGVFVVNPVFAKVENSKQDIFKLIDNLFDKTKITEDSVKVEGHKIYYLEAGYGNKGGVLFLHGLFAQKEQWIKTMELFVKKGYYVIAPDLPGYGKSKQYPLSVYSVDKQVKLLHKFINELGLENINIAGNSLGGTIALAYACKYENNIKSLALLGGPAGLVRWSPEIVREFDKGKNPFIPLTKKDFYKEMNMLFHQPPKIPEEVAIKMVTGYKTNYERLKSAFALFSVSIYNFAVKMKTDLQIPTLIIWGYDDKIFTVKNALNAKKKIAGSKLVILKNTGHLIMLESPKEIFGVYEKFLRKNTD
ncbi:MAG: alpha/beta hydrolase [Victivallales bacterium]|nr:alpha/beta hydrolase [Victivallales bacterium]MCF7888659.1 alpha/beta hydrolase [Victivallales bacterium]